MLMGMIIPNHELSRNTSRGKFSIIISLLTLMSYTAKERTCTISSGAVGSLICPARGGRGDLRPERDPALKSVILCAVMGQM